MLSRVRMLTLLYDVSQIEEHMTDYPVPKLDEGVVRSYEQVVALTKSKDKKKDILLDARPAGR